ncbi:MAG: glutaredoxin domain-containing protein [Prolixibacteraceae bacterium]|jgi:glutaredoxin-like YruB-family protein|nr:glutaredoxin domain-containing protein [Prolixibacteraceae bacterium]
MKTFHSYQELNHELSRQVKVFVLLYKGGSEQSDCAFRNLLAVSENNHSGAAFLCADVKSAGDIHPEFGISTVPSLLEFQNGELKNVYKGCYPVEQLKSIVTRQVAVITGNRQQTTRNVIVYSTPTCSWCTTLKNYLREYNIRFRDVDVSRDEQMARAMVRKSGQQGVPQIEINGQIVVGFDREKINRLLEINH